MSEIAVEYRAKSPTSLHHNGKGVGPSGFLESPRKERSKNALNSSPTIVNTVVCYSGRATPAQDSAAGGVHIPSGLQNPQDLLSFAHPSVRVAQNVRRLYDRLHTKNPHTPMKESEYSGAPTQNCCIQPASTVMNWKKNGADPIIEPPLAREHIKLEYGRGVQVRTGTQKLTSTSQTNAYDIEVLRTVRRFVSPPTGNTVYKKQTALDSTSASRVVHSSKMRAPDKSEYESARSELARVQSPAASEPATMKFRLAQTQSPTSTSSQYRAKSPIAEDPSNEVSDVCSRQHGVVEYVSKPRYATSNYDPTSKTGAKQRRASRSISSSRQSSTHSSKKTLSQYTINDQLYIKPKHYITGRELQADEAHSCSVKSIDRNIWVAGRLSTDAVDSAFCALAVHCLNIPKLSKSWPQESSIKTEAGFDPFEGEPPKMPANITLTLPQSYVSRLTALDCL